MTDTQAQISAWLATYSVATASAADLLCDRHPPERTALSFVDAERQLRTLSYAELRDRSERLAGHLAERGVRQGDCVGVLLGKRAELAVSLLALARLGAVYVPLFTAFAPPAIAMRLQGSASRLVITEPSQLAKLDGLGVDSLVAGPDFEAAIAAATPWSTALAVGGEGSFLQLFTSGTTGAPKGVAVPVRALTGFHSYMHYGLDVRADDVLWNIADPGWAYGLYFAVVGPLLTGCGNLLYAGPFDPAVTYELIEQLGVSNFAAAPTIYRNMSKAFPERKIQLRRASSAGEPLTSDILAWASAHLGTEVRDHYGQTEVGMVIGNHWADQLRRPLKPGSMGSALPGFRVSTVDGAIAVDTQNSPAMWFGGYVNEPTETAKRFTADGRWYLTGDLGREDEEGDLFFASRDDDLILMAGYRISPFDLESIIINHPAIVDVAIAARPDPEGLRGEVAVVYAVVREGHTADSALASELQDMVRKGYGAYAVPRQVIFVDALPKTPSGKTQRFMLRRGDYG